MRRRTITASATRRGDKRRGTLGGDVSWKNVPNSLIVADAVVAGLLDGVLPEHRSAGAWIPPSSLSITRRDRARSGSCQRGDRGRDPPAPPDPLVQGQELAVPDRTPLDRCWRQGAQDHPARRDRHPTLDGPARRPARRHRLRVVRRRGPGQDPGRPRLPASRSQVAVAGRPSPRPPRPRPRSQPPLGRQEVAQGSRKDQPSYFWEWERTARSARTPARWSASWCSTSTSPPSSASGSRLRSGIRATWASAWCRTIGRIPPRRSDRARPRGS